MSVLIWNDDFELPGSYSVSGYYLKLLTPETMELLGSTTNKITKNENGENVPHQY